MFCTPRTVRPATRRKSLRRRKIGRADDGAGGRVVPDWQGVAGLMLTTQVLVTKTEEPGEDRLPAVKGAVR